MKVGEEIRVTGEVKDDGVLIPAVDWALWTLSGKARQDDANGKELGVFTMSKPSDGVYLGTCDTAGFPPGRLVIDIKFEPPGMNPAFTRTMSIELEQPVTRP